MLHLLEVTVLRAVSDSTGGGSHFIPKEKCRFIGHLLVEAHFNRRVRKHFDLYKPKTKTGEKLESHGTCVLQNKKSNRLRQCSGNITFHIW